MARSEPFAGTSAVGLSGCRLAAGAMEQVVGLQASLAGALGLIVDKFGKQEAAGRGLRGLIGEACRLGPVGARPAGPTLCLAIAADAAQLPADVDQRWSIGCSAGCVTPAMPPPIDRDTGDHP